MTLPPTPTTAHADSSDSSLQHDTPPARHSANGLVFLLGFYVRHRSLRPGALAGIVATLLADVGILLLVAFMLKQALAVLGSATPATQVWSIALQCLALLLAKLLVDVVQARLLAQAVLGTLENLRLRLFAHLQRLPGASFRQAHFGPDTSSLLAGSAQTAADFLAQTAPKIAQNLLLAVFSVLAMATLDWRLTLVCLAAILVTLPIPRMFARRHRRILRQGRGQEARALGIVDEALVMHAVIRAFDLAATWLARFQHAHHDLARTQQRVVRVQRLYEGSMVNLANFLVFVLLVAAMALSGQGRIAIDMVGAFFVLLQYVANVISRLGTLLVRTTPAEHAARQIDEFLARPALPLPDDQTAGAATFRDGLRFENVGFAYTPGHPVLEQLDFSVRPGESVALVGPSGSGKSSVLALLMREYAPQQGRVTLDGRDVAAIPQADYARLVATITQDTRLFNVSVRENIRAGRPGASDAEVMEAALQAEAHTMVLGLPQGYDTAIVEYGGNLSGGQRQRIAIARALVARPSLLLVDEATSALDAETEAAINASLARIALVRTVVQVTHRLRAAAQAHRILVMEGGRIVESGTHAELARRGGSYARLLQKQLAVDFDGHHPPRVDTGLLRRIDLFAQVGEAALQQMAHSLMPERVPADTVLFTEGSEGDKFYVVARGKLEVRRAQETVAFLDDGDCFGEIALLANVPRTGTVVARTDCVLLALDRQQFRAIVGQDTVLQARLDALVAHRSQALSAAPAGFPPAAQE